MVDKLFEDERKANIKAMQDDAAFAERTNGWLAHAQERKYSYQFDWMGLPIIQYPQDVIAMQELVWAIKPDLIIETGIARGGSAIFYASLLELNAMCGGPADAKVVAVDIDIRDHNRKAIEAHPMAKRLHMIQGSSIDADIVSQVKAHAEDKKTVLLCLDSNHTHEHVLEELRAYAPLVTKGSYAVVFDTLIEDLPTEAIGDRPWGSGDNPLTAINAYLKENDGFEIDEERHTKLQITVAKSGYLRCIR
ncbi:cephalosporin hydroxylase family protein [Loktanella sp. S4079]|uniref:cephalosporin hydroxylase family protein n=1 Tax=Loktanella sp. S4079 TaxID=579483 RepID=UPI0005F9D627|nr:cephalosporin hydroxylase family protein [Loktanella sp. S4079]KJZ18636.1 cephalosporin hydroxylase [Loktanella sp. S4079]